jgi:DNA-binding MarR family transcriptional regulator
MSGDIDKRLTLQYNSIMQISHNANNYGGRQQQPYAEQAARFIKEIAEVMSPPPDEVIQLASRLVGAQFKDIPDRISNPHAFHRISGILHQKPSSTMGELSQALSVPLYTATRMIDSLVENGLADRLSDPDDRRIVRVTLTDDGLRFHEAIEAHIAQKVHRIMACLTPEEQGILIALLRKVTASLKESET